MSKEIKISQSEIKRRIKQVTQEAEFRFKCVELASSFSKKIEDLLPNATAIYNYAFHINADLLKKQQENESK